MGGIVSMVSGGKEEQLLIKNTRLNLEVDEWEDPKRPKTPAPDAARPPPKLIWRGELQEVGVFFPEDEPHAIHETKNLPYEFDRVDEEDEEDYGEEEKEGEERVMYEHKQGEAVVIVS